MHPTSRRARLTLLTITIIALLAGAFMIWYTQDLEPQAPKLATSTPLPQAQLFRVDITESDLRVTVDAAMGAVEGGYLMSGGTVELDAAGSGWHVVVNLSLDARTLDIGNPTLNDVMRRALKVEEFPTGTFVASSDETLADLSAPQAITLTGQIELHGTVQDYTIPATFTLEGDQITLRAQIVIDAEQFGASIPGLLADNELDGDLTVVAYRAAS